MRNFMIRSLPLSRSDRASTPLGPASGTDRVRFERASLGLVDPQDLLEGLASASGCEAQDQGLPLELATFDAHRLRPELRRPLVVSMHRLVQEMVLALEALTTELESAPDVLRGAAVDHEIHEPLHVLCVVPLDELVDEFRRRSRSARGCSPLGLPQSSPAPMERRLDGPLCGREDFGDLLETRVEDVLQEHRRTLLWREPLQQPRARIA
jgi:hypothetical protein